MDDFVELLWDGGNVMMQAQTSRPNPNNNSNTNSNNKKSSSSTQNTPFSFSFPFPFLPTPFDEEEMHKKKKKKKKTLDTERALAPDLFSNHESEHVRVREGDTDTDTDTDTVPWIDYPTFDASDDYCSELLSNLNPNPPISKPLHIQPSVPVLKSPQDVPPSHKQTLPRAGQGLINFSHFSRPVALAKATLQSAERSRSNAKASTSYNNFPLESTVIQPVSLPQPQTLPCQNVPPPSSQSVERNQLLERDKEEEKTAKPVLASSSVCSRNVDPKNKLKRKSLEDDFLSHTEDVEDESVGSKRPNTLKGMCTKRSRTAEVHNLSERRRRDRINEKMRALQELIPNCNKVDKASMLDEAIEYLKSLQFQVQMMAMGTGMCMPPMMLPPGLHHMPVAPFPQMEMGMMGMGMGMGMGYGMGALDINNSAVIHAVPPPPPPRTPSPTAAAAHAPLNFMRVINGAIPTYANGIPPASISADKANACELRSWFDAAAQGEKRHVNRSGLAQSGEVGVNPTNSAAS